MLCYVMRITVIAQECILSFFSALPIDLFHASILFIFIPELETKTKEIQLYFSLN